MVDVVGTCASVLDEAASLAREGVPAGTCVAAREQTAGRARLGRVWESPAEGLAVAVVLRPKAPMGLLSGLSSVAGLGAVDALRALGAPVSLAWPDDVVDACGRKLGGAVCSAGYGEGGVFVVAGVYVNVLPPDGDLATAGSPAPREAAGLASLLDTVPGLETLAAAIGDAVVSRVRAWEDGIAAGQGTAGPLGPVLSEWFDEMSLMGREVRVLLPDGRVAAEGMLAGIDGWGRVTVRTDDGRELEFSSEQGSVRPR